MEDCWRDRGVKGFSRPIVPNIFFLFWRELPWASKYNLWYFLSGWVCACVYNCLTEGIRKKGKRYTEKVELCTRMSVHARGRFWYSQREKSVSYLSLCFKGRGMKAIFKWHLQSRSTWTQSAPVRPKWTTGEFLWRRKLNANHTKRSHSHTSIRHSHAIRGNKKHYNRTSAAPLEVPENPPRVKSTALRQQQMPKTCDYGANHAGGGYSSNIRFTARKDARLLFVAPHDCWWQSRRDTRNIPLHPLLSPPAPTRFFRLWFFWTLNLPPLPKRLTLRPLGAVSWMSSAV